MIMKNIDSYSYTWEQPENYVLVKGTRTHIIMNIKEDAVLLIEDDDLAETVQNKMIEHGCRVMSMDDYLAMLKETPPKSMSGVFQYGWGSAQSKRGRKRGKVV